MAKKRKGKEKLQVSSSDVDTQFKAASRGAFSSLGHLDLPSLSQPISPEEPKETSESPQLVSQVLGPQKKLKLALSKKGRGGKVVTTLQTRNSDQDSGRSQLAKQLGKALGCRVWVEDDHLCLQGDQRDRIRHWVNQQL